MRASVSAVKLGTAISVVGALGELNTKSGPESCVQLKVRVSPSESELPDASRVLVKPSLGAIFVTFILAVGAELVTGVGVGVGVPPLGTGVVTVVLLPPPPPPHAIRAVSYTHLTLPTIYSV